MKVYVVARDNGEIYGVYLDLREASYRRCQVLAKYEWDSSDAVTVNGYELDVNYYDGEEEKNDVSKKV
jgi:hypothetical protein